MFKRLIPQSVRGGYTGSSSAVDCHEHEERDGILAASGPWQPVLAGLVGLIPNCVSSVLITQLYAAGQLSLGGVVAGLCTGAGVGLAVLLRANKNAKQNLFIVALLYDIGVAAGLVCSLFA